MRDDINGNTKVYGLIGKGINKSLSPFIHNSLNKYMGINSLYACFETNSIKSAINGGKALGIKGFNITTPFKQEVIPFLSSYNREVIDLNSVNTLLLEESGYKGYNTDYYGFFQLLSKNNIDVKGKKVLVIGAGGTSATLCKALDNLYIKELNIANRSLEKAENIKAKLNNIDVVKVVALDEIDDNYDVIIQSTTVGFNNNDIPININKIKKCTYAIDIIYGQDKTLFLKECEKKGFKSIDGLDMLFFQAVKAYEIFNNIKVTEIVIEKCKNDLYRKVYG